MRKTARQLGWFLARYALWIGVSVIVFRFLDVMSPLLLFVASLVGFLLVVEYSEPALSEAGLRGWVWLVSAIGIIAFVILMTQWALAELQTLLAQSP